MHLPRPFKNPTYNKNVNRRAKNMKAIISQERERERAERERRRVLGAKLGGGGSGTDASAMDVVVDGLDSTDAALAEEEEEEEVPTCNVAHDSRLMLTLTRTRYLHRSTALDLASKTLLRYYRFRGSRPVSSPSSLRPHVHRLHTRTHLLVSDSTTRAYTTSSKAL